MPTMMASPPMAPIRRPSQMDISHILNKGSNSGPSELLRRPSLVRQRQVHGSSNIGTTHHHSSNKSSYSSYTRAHSPSLSTISTATTPAAATGSVVTSPFAFGSLSSSSSLEPLPSLQRSCSAESGSDTAARSPATPPDYFTSSNTTPSLLFTHHLGRHHPSNRVASAAADNTSTTATSTSTGERLHQFPSLRDTSLGPLSSSSASLPKMDYVLNPSQQFSDEMDYSASSSSFMPSLQQFNHQQQQAQLLHHHRQHQQHQQQPLFQQPLFQQNPLSDQLSNASLPRTSIDESYPSTQRNSTSSTGGARSTAGKKNSYACPLSKQYNCPEHFTTSGHAARHAKKHTGKRDAICPECKKAFTRKDNMEQHRRTHQPGRASKSNSSDAIKEKRKTLKLQHQQNSSSSSAGSGHARNDSMSSTLADMTMPGQAGMPSNLISPQAHPPQMINLPPLHESMRSPLLLSPADQLSPPIYWSLASPSQSMAQMHGIMAATTTSDMERPKLTRSSYSDSIPMVPQAIMRPGSRSSSDSNGLDILANAAGNASNQPR